jgi:hypothetical protein
LTMFFKLLQVCPVSKPLSFTIGPTIHQKVR